MTKEELKQEAEEYADKLARKLNVPSDSELLLYARNAFLAGAEPREKCIAELESENQKWKDEWQEKVQEATDEGYARTLQTIQLTKAKNLLQKVADVCGYPNYDIPVVLYSDIADFLKDSEVEK